MTDFRELQEWEKAHELTVAVYEITKTFPEEELQGLTQQIRLACASIPIKIAQACDRDDYEIQLDFLETARDAVIEVEYYLLLCYELQMVDSSNYDRLISDVVEVKELLASYIDKQSRNF
ncbi:four helix bundle protein [Umezakia ovalisporum]|jgi:four helix bundle protein|uniref:Four helix bundle protein n=2 Tax=Umezakia ovalisporum TaxID=75695 RepID=A0AA43GYV5_9CYAN|nr:four helix bundle protein [Umezakia ovalisporum]MBI1240730.1 four helix bundle protein [Nostoc sp. RI_552]MDH6056895.1 four helix bundle protein [Umezakia ovalisporum FSS-43]MDH6064369.1 four helix bundle protein [Umezakia ovalisporum FSS-62]MDH6067983.1 four helix bundle protein [Umezakia ovalisporum APH033B]MDH6070935.1 four helix bundle protein [Umezakia ovalisporum CobakiLakeA]